MTLGRHGDRDRRALVDDAIIDVENVVRRLRENHDRPEGERRSSGDVVRDATIEIRSSIVFATVIIVLVFLPIFGLSGVEGRLLTPLAFAYIVSLLASLVVAIDRDAGALLRLSARRTVHRPRARGMAGARAESAISRETLPYALDHPVAVTVVGATLLAVAIVAMTRMGSAFLPDFHEGGLTIQANTLPGTSLEKSDQIGRRVEQILLAQPEVIATARRTGRAGIRRARARRRGRRDRRGPSGNGAVA